MPTLTILPTDVVFTVTGDEKKQTNFRNYYELFNNTILCRVLLIIVCRRRAISRNRAEDGLRGSAMNARRVCPLGGTRLTGPVADAAPPRANAARQPPPPPSRQKRRRATRVAPRPAKPITGGRRGAQTSQRRGLRVLPPLPPP